MMLSALARQSGWRVIAGSAAFALLPGSSLAGYDPDADPVPWEEKPPKTLPAVPTAGRLIEFVPGGRSGNRFMIDPLSLAPGEDNVMRFVMVIESPAGARSVTYEGIRCDTRERKLYATGKPDGAWLPSKSPAWRAIAAQNFHNPVYIFLWREHFCEGPALRTDLDRVIATMRSGFGIDR